MTFGPLVSSCATLFVTSSVPSAQLVLVTVPAEESTVVVPAALQFHVGDVWKLVVHCVASTLTDGGNGTPIFSQPFCELPSQSSFPVVHGVQVPDAHVWLFVQFVVVHVVPQLVSWSMDFSHPFAGEPSQSRNPMGHAMQEPLAHVSLAAAHEAAE